MALDEKFHPLKTAVQKPARFTFPFCYQPHRLSQLAAKDLCDYVEHRPILKDILLKGKMLGVLVVETDTGETGYIAAFSGQLQGRNDYDFFVPPIFDATAPDGYFKTNEARISSINHEIEAIANSAEYAAAQQEMHRAQAEAEREEAEYRAIMQRAKARRDGIRLTTTDIDAATAVRLIRESQFMKAELRRIKKRNKDVLAQAKDKKDALDLRIYELKERRSKMSDELQQWLFSHYNMLNAHGDSRPLTEIFAETPAEVPPAGAGDCCAPKLLQYAYLHALRPVCMAEFWYGASPRTEVRHHLHYYPACRGKCLPILTWMLQGLDVDSDPQLTPCTEPLKIVWEDETLIVVDKPAGMASVDGRLRVDTVESLLNYRDEGNGHIRVAHRLDMDTSGLIVAAKTAEAYRNIQKQFQARTVKKLYLALLDGPVKGKPQGEINLPLCPDPLDRPYQKIDFEHGKPALTTYRIIKRTSTGTIVELTPHTGRTHQLRIHCASRLGLGAPIHGDRLYGHPGNRLYLHAARLSFTHPVTGKVMTFDSKADFCPLLK